MLIYLMISYSINANINQIKKSEIGMYYYKVIENLLLQIPWCEHIGSGL